MQFKERLSVAQHSAILAFILGILLIIFAPSIPPENTRWIGVLIIVFSVLGFYRETKRKYLILHPFKRYRPRNPSERNKYHSKGERKVAEYFQRKNIRFILHPQLKLHTKCFMGFHIPFLKRELEPDFYLPEFEVFVEYASMINDPDYRKKFRLKRVLCDKNGVEYIILYSTENLDYVFTSKLLEIMKERQGIQRYWR